MPATEFCQRRVPLPPKKSLPRTFAPPPNFAAAKTAVALNATDHRRWKTVRAWTGVEIEKEKDRLEREAAGILGYMLFEYSRLDMELGLLLVWSGDGRNCDFLTKKLGEYSIYRRLQCLGDLVETRYADIPEAYELYSSWLADAHNTRVLRNQLIHGRWGIEASKRKVVNVMGLPTSQEHKSTPFSLEELQCALESIKELRTRLHELRKLWPV